MSTSIESIGIHPIVVLTISDFYNRMRVTSQGKVSRVYGALMGQKIGTKVEIFSAFEFVNNSSDENKIDLDLNYIDTRRDSATQLFPKFDIVGFFSTNKTSQPNENDKQILKAMNYFGVINPVYLVLSTTDINKQKELPVGTFFFEKNIEKFIEVRHIIEGWESERICLETVTKNTDVANEENGLVKNIQTTQNAMGVLKEHLNLIKKNISKFKDDPKFKQLIEDLIINYPSIEKSEYQTLMSNKQKEILLLNNLCMSTLQGSYMGLTQNKI
jgi:COP9 signalosome complex subunit 6